MDYVFVFFFFDAFAILLYSSARLTQYCNSFFDCTSSTSTKTNPFINLPVKSIGLHPSFSITSSYFWGSILTINRSCSTPIHILSFTIKQRPPNIFFSSIFFCLQQSVPVPCPLIFPCRPALFIFNSDPGKLQVLPLQAGLANL